ncbi:hypothetical protein [Cellulomonas sp. P5_C6]
MIDLAAPLLVPGAVRAWRDDTDAGRVWACAAGPRWVVAPDGGPDVSLVLYRRGTGPVEGGTATLGVDLALTAAERDAVVRAATPPATRERPTPPPPVLAPPEWLTGTVRIDLADGVTASTAPSLLGDNRATVVLTLDATSAPAVAAAWAADLPDAHAVADLQVRAVRRSSATASGPTVTVAVDVAHSTEEHLTLESDLHLPAAARISRLSDIHL